ncbi:MAG: hypothetical protein AB8H80_15055 [Planctomycetota bacterium]
MFAAVETLLRGAKAAMCRPFFGRLRPLAALLAGPLAWLLAGLTAAETERLMAQQAPGLPTERTVALAPGSWLDLDTGAALPQRTLGQLIGDLRIDRDGLGFFVDAPHGAQEARRDAIRPHEATGWQSEDAGPPLRWRLSGRSEQGNTWFVRTDHGVARVRAAVINPYSLASSLVQWVVVPPTEPVFLPPPQNVQLKRTEGGVRVRWTAGDGDGECRYLVELVVAEASTAKAVGPRETVAQPQPQPQPKATVWKETVAGRSHEFRDVPAGRRLVASVRSLVRGGISTPARAVRHGRVRAVERASVDFLDRWFDATGGLSLQDAEQAEDGRADVVFYLYGVYVPGGGGVQKLGSGRDVFAAARRLPATGYLPSYGRLDEEDVLAIELPDGRRGMVWLEALDGSDVRSGMRVHTVFAADGRSELLAMPRPKAQFADGVATLSWPAVPGASSYAVAVAGRADVVTRECQIQFSDLAADRVHVLRVASRDKLGDRSLSAEALVPTFGADAVHRHATLRAQAEGLRLVDAAAVPVAAADLSLVGGAGGSAVLHFDAPHGWAPLGRRAFGDFAELPERETGRLTVADEASERFFVFAKDGGCACVRIVQRGWPDCRLEYVLLPKERFPR